MTTLATLEIPPRFCGPSGTANGGYACGLLASFAEEGVTVRLIEPIPLDTELTVVARGEHVELEHGGRVIAQARPGSLGALAPPAPPTPEKAREASTRYAGYFLNHPAPECFVCGPSRYAGDALCVYAGPLDARDEHSAVAATWEPDPSLDDGSGRVATPFVWAALDCPGFAAIAPDFRPMLLGELTARIDRPVAIGETTVVVGWPLGSEGRKHEAGTAIFTARGELAAIARAIWIEPKPASA